MQSLLERLDIHPKVQSFFQPYLKINTCEELIFKHEDYFEHVGTDFHRRPTGEAHWTAGDPILASQVFIANSAMDHIAWLNNNHHQYKNLNELFFISLAANADPCNSLRALLPINTHKKIHLLFSSDDLGATWDLKVAAAIRGTALKVRVSEGHFMVNFKLKNYELENLSLHALEKAAGYHFHIRTHKPKNHTTYYDQLRHRHPP